MGGTILDAPPEGWGIMIYSDSHQATVSGSTTVIKEGIDYLKMYLKPHDAIIKRFEINEDFFDKNGYCYKWYPKEMIIQLNPFEPSRRVYFCLLNWEGKETDSTRSFLGKEQAEEVIRLHHKIRNIMAHLARLKMENKILKTNVNKYIKDTVEGVIKPTIPLVSDLINASDKYTENERRRTN